jgi:hypothetical protein
VGRLVPGMAERLGMEVLYTRTISKLAKPSDLTWEWPNTFLNIYLPKISERGLLTSSELADALANLEALTAMPNAMLMCPVVIETVMKK